MSNPSTEEIEIQRRLRIMTRRAVVIGGSSALVAGAAWKWVGSRSRDQLLAWPLRRVLEFDQKVGQALFNPKKPAPTFPTSLARMPRINGGHGINHNLDLERWRLQVEGPAGNQAFRLDEIKALPRVEMTTELKCVEGWSEIVTWAGARLADLAALTGLARVSGQKGEVTSDTLDLLPFVSLVTPDRKYFVGLDMASALHPQTLLCYEMNGKPLTLDHGAPLRLAIPLKYGIKSLKQIGTLSFTRIQPADYWAEKGYDWYAGH